MISRKPEEATRGDYDLAIVGGGVYGVALALEAVRRGLRPVLVERGDFGGETSWNSLRIVHGGLRYLQSADLLRFRESIDERRSWFREFPDLVERLACLMPLYGNGLRRVPVLRAALAVNDLLSWKRNKGVRPDRAIPSGRVLTLDETVALFPSVDRRGLQGAALWHDAAMPDSHRLVIEMLHWATAGGAVALNYVEGESLLLSDGRVAGVLAVDRISGQRLELNSPVVVNCAGPWCAELANRFDRDIPGLFPPSVAFNALVDRPPLSEAALAVEPRSGGRTYFLHPWKGYILAGTYHAACGKDVTPRRFDDEQLERFIRDLNDTIPGFELGRNEILRVHWGLLPARETGTEVLAVREKIVHHGDVGGPKGLFSVSGVKFTTARRVAKKTLARVRAVLGQPLPERKGPDRPPAAGIPARGEFERLLGTDRHAAATIVTRVVESEAVVHLDDIVLRRTDWGIDPRHGLRFGREVVELLEWTVERKERELRLLESSLTRAGRVGAT